MGTIALPQPGYLPSDGTLRHEAVRGMAVDAAGRLYVSTRQRLLQLSIGERKVLGPRDVLPAGELATCLARAPDGGLAMMTTAHDLVVLDAAGGIKTRWTRPVVQLEPRHHGCDSVAFDGQGNVWLSPVGAPAIYAFTPSGALLRRHTPGGSGHYLGLSVLEDGSVVVGYYEELLVLGPDFQRRPGPKRHRGGGWAWISEVLRSPEDELIVATQLGVIARWQGASRRW